MANLMGTGGPPAFIAFPCIVIYIKLMRQITSRPMAHGLNIDKEKVLLFMNIETNHLNENKLLLYFV